MQEYSNRFFTDLQSQMKTFTYKSVIHGNVLLNKMNFNHFVLNYVSLIDCLLKKFLNELKNANEDDVSNWKSLKTVSSYAFFWSIASYLTTE